MSEWLKKQNYQHQSLLYWTEIFIDEIFQTNLLLTDEIPKLPVETKPHMQPYDTTVFNPENEKSNGRVSQSFEVVNPRGKSIELALPSLANLSIAGPPGKPNFITRAILSKASPAASSMVSPSFVIEPVMSSTCNSDECPPLTSKAIVGSSGLS